jgi:hypothetical protein
MLTIPLLDHPAVIMERKTLSVRRFSRSLRVLLTILLIRDTEDGRGKAIGR